MKLIITALMLFPLSVTAGLIPGYMYPDLEEGISMVCDSQESQGRTWHVCSANGNLTMDFGVDGRRVYRMVVHDVENQSWEHLTRIFRLSTMARERWLIGFDPQPELFKACKETRSEQ